jgi:hypothetical protein
MVNIENYICNLDILGNTLKKTQVKLTLVIYFI